jgi:hypothetical protein
VPADKYKDTSYNMRLKLNTDTVKDVARLLVTEPTTTLKPYLFLLDPETPSQRAIGAKMSTAEFQESYNAHAELGQQQLDSWLGGFKFIILGGNHGYYGRQELLKQLAGDKDRLKTVPNGFWMRGQVVVGASKQLAVKVSFFSELSSG